MFVFSFPLIDTGPWCFCKDPEIGENITRYCTPPKSTPEQINLQMAASGVVVVGFVTYENAQPQEPPVAIFSNDGGVTNVTISGVSHWYSPPGRSDPSVPPPGGSRRYAYPYTMHYIKFPLLKSGQNYSYKVRSGSEKSTWSEWFHFRGPAVAGEVDKPTRIATYGDMGHR